MNFVPIKPQDLDYIPTESRPNLCIDTRGIMALDAEGIPQAIAVFDSWSFNSVQIHIWIENPFVLKHGFAEEVFRFAFSEESGRTLIIGITPSDNERALKFIKHIGFKYKCKIKDGYKIGVDYIVTEMRKNKCRYL